MIRIYAPASIGNIGVGFDLLGIAVSSIDGGFFGDCVTIENASAFSLEHTGNFSDQLPKKWEQDIIFLCWKKFCTTLGEMYPLFIKLEKNIPVASGLGSSACSIVATLVAINYYCGSPLDNNQLLFLMGEIEGDVSGSIHFDNVSPCFLGGMQLILQEYDIISQKIPIFDDWLWVVAYPGIAIPTVTARSVLPKEYNRMDCINYGRYLSGFIHACHTQQEALAIRCMKDIIAEPYRSKLLPMQLSDIRRILVQKGAVSCGISGAGPTIFALCNTKETADVISYWLSCHYLQNKMGFVRICCLNNVGTYIKVDD